MKLSFLYILQFLNITFIFAFCYHWDNYECLFYLVLSNDFFLQVLAVNTTLLSIDIFSPTHQLSRYIEALMSHA